MWTFFLSAFLFMWISFFVLFHIFLWIINIFFDRFRTIPKQKSYYFLIKNWYFLLIFVFYDFFYFFRCWNHVFCRNNPSKNRIIFLICVRIIYWSPKSGNK